MKTISRPTLYDVEVHFVKSPLMRQFNARYRGIKKATDILSFPGSIPNLLGSLVIDLDVAEKQAKQYSHSLFREVMELFAHGVLHLNGYDHETKQEAQIMTSLEELVLNWLNRKFK